MCRENCLSLAKSIEFDINQSIIWQKKSKVSLTSYKKRSLMLLQLGRMKYINDLKMVILTEILSTHHQFLLQKLYVEEDIGISLCKFDF